MKHKCVGVVLLLAPALRAAPFTWDGGAVLGPQWSRDNNWVGNNAPPNNGTADLTFTGDERLDAEADGAWNIRSMTFGNFAGSSAFSIQGGTLTIGIGGITNFDASFQFINNNIVLASAQTWTTIIGSLGIDGSVNTNGNLLTLEAATGKRIVVDNAITGSGAVVFNGPGQLFYTGASANNYTGQTTINSGQLSLDKTTGVTVIAGNLVIGDGVAAAKVHAPAANLIANTCDVTIPNAGELELVDGDFDSDNDVDLNDLGTLATNFEGGRAPAYAAFQTLVPEPAAGLWLLLLLVSPIAQHRPRDFPCGR